MPKIDGCDCVKEQYPPRKQLYISGLISVLRKKNRKRAINISDMSVGSFVLPINMIDVRGLKDKIKDCRLHSMNFSRTLNKRDNKSMSSKGSSRFSSKGSSRGSSRGSSKRNSGTNSVGWEGSLIQSSSCCGAQCFTLNGGAVVKSSGRVPSKYSDLTANLIWFKDKLRERIHTINSCNACSS